MIIEQTSLVDCFVITPQVFYDDRGYFLESFNSRTFKENTKLEIDFVQDNQSVSSKGVLRGLHFQTGLHAQAKLVTVLRGSVLDVCVDLRPTSKTFGKYLSIILNEENKQQLFIPRGFAHGFLVLEDNTMFSYKCDNFYNKDSERGIVYNDPTLKIDWGFDDSKIILSKKDANLPTFDSLFV